MSIVVDHLAPGARTTGLWTAAGSTQIICFHSLSSKSFMAFDFSGAGFQITASGNDSSFVIWITPSVTCKYYHLAAAQEKMVTWTFVVDTDLFRRVNVEPVNLTWCTL